MILRLIGVVTSVVIFPVGIIVLIFYFCGHKCIGTENTVERRGGGREDVEREGGGREGGRKGGMREGGMREGGRGGREGGREGDKGNGREH